MLNKLERYEQAKKKPFRILDLVLIIILLLVGILLWLVPNKSVGNTVIVTSGGVKIGEYDISVSRVVEINYSDEKNVIKIEGGKVSVISSTCSGKECVHVGQISIVGEKIVCLPNKLIIEIVSQESGLDGVV